MLMREQYEEDAEDLMETTADQTIQEDAEITRAGRSAIIYQAIVQSISDMVTDKIVGDCF